MNIRKIIYYNNQPIGLIQGKVKNKNWRIFRMDNYLLFEGEGFWARISRKLIPAHFSYGDLLALAK